MRSLAWKELKYPPELRGRAVRTAAEVSELWFEVGRDRGRSRHVLGVGIAETLPTWVHQAEVHADQRVGD
jgi:hypothetical protein